MRFRGGVLLVVRRLRRPLPIVRQPGTWTYFLDIGLKLSDGHSRAPLLAWNPQAIVSARTHRL